MAKRMGAFSAASLLSWCCSPVFVGVWRCHWQPKESVQQAGGATSTRR
jgi:hypothetical protein